MRRRPWSWLTIVALLALCGALLLYLGRTTTFWFDEWTWIAYRRGDSLSTFLASYNGHFSLVPILAYRVLFAAAGLTHYAIYRAVAVGLHLLLGALVFRYARSRVGDVPALCAATLVLFLGAGWQEVLWPFQLAWLITLCAGLGALILLDRDQRPADIGASALLMVALASSGVGAVFVPGVVVELAWARRRWREAWLFAIPVVLYGFWWLKYEQSPPLAPLRLVPGFLAHSIPAAAGGLAGASAGGPSDSVLGSAALLTVGRPLALIGALLLGWRFVRLRRIPARALTLLVIAGAFWFLTALTRAQFLFGSQAWASRYLYVGGLFLVLIAVESCQGARIPGAVQLALAAAVLVAAALGVTNFRNAAYQLRAIAHQTRADLAAIEIGRQVVPPHYVMAYLPGYPFIQVTARAYLSAAGALGSPAARPGALPAYPNPARQVTDAELLRLHGAILARARGRAPTGPLPPATGTAAATSAGCAALAAGRGLELISSAPRLQLTPRAGEIVVEIRRFASSFMRVGVARPPGIYRLTIAPDGSSRSWDVRLSSSARGIVCGLG